jgi:hypothetical protein
VKIDHLGETLRFATYSSRMIDDPAGIAEELRLSAAEQGIEFDTIVGRGSSGMLIVPLVAQMLGKKWFIVRKDEEVQSSHDSSCKWMGDLGNRWIFLDDFCSSGETFRKVRDGVKAAVKEATASFQSWGYPQGDSTGRLGWYTYTRPPFETELVGYFQYESREDNCRTLIPWDEDATPGYNDRYWDDTPRGLAQRALQDAVRDEEEALKGERLQAEADQRRGAELDQSVEIVPPGYRSVIADCGPDCIVCNEVMDANQDEVAVTTWSSVRPISRYTMQLAAQTNPNSNMIVRNT